MVFPLANFVVFSCAFLPQYICNVILTFFDLLLSQIHNTLARLSSSIGLTLQVLCTDGSFADDGSAGAGMVSGDDKGAIIFSSCRQLFSYRESPRS